MEEVYVFNPEEEEVLVHGNKLKNGAIILDSGEEFVPPEGCEVIVAENFYESSRVPDDIIPKLTSEDEYHHKKMKIFVECMFCGFKSEFAAYLLFGMDKLYPSSDKNCIECGENVWKEINREVN